MTIEQAFRDVLLASAGVVKIVEDRVFPGQAPQTAKFPRIEYGQIGRTPDVHHGGRGNADRWVMDVHCVATGMEAARELADAVDAALAPPSTHASIGVCIFDDETATVDQPPDGSDVRTRTIIQTYIVWAA